MTHIRYSALAWSSIAFVLAVAIICFLLQLQLILAQFCLSRYDLGFATPSEWADHLSAGMDNFPPENLILGSWQCEEHLPREHITGLIDGMLTSAAHGCDASAAASTHSNNDAAGALKQAQGIDGAAVAPPMRVRLHTTHFGEIDVDSAAGEWVRNGAHFYALLRLAPIAQGVSACMC